MKSKIKIIKKAVSIRELQKQGFKKTKISGLYVSNLGLCYNVVLNRKLTVTAKKNVIIDGKSYNLAKVILETFKKIPIRNGFIVFNNGNDSDFSIDNIEY